MLYKGIPYRYSYGEAILRARDLAFEKPIEDGVVRLGIGALEHAPKMTRKDAVDYYNKKLEWYWLDRMDKRIPFRKRKKALNYLLGRRQDDAIS